jgi:hypothetical protein
MSKVAAAFSKGSPVFVSVSESLFEENIIWSVVPFTYDGLRSSGMSSVIWVFVPADTL